MLGFSKQKVADPHSITVAAEKVFVKAIGAAIACAREGGVGEGFISRELSGRASVIDGQLRMAAAARAVATPRA
jgi:hypothetical protein